MRTFSAARGAAVTAVATLLTAVLGGAPRAAAAQSSEFELHGIFERATTGATNAGGGGVNVGLGFRLSPAAELSTELGFDDVVLVPQNRLPGERNGKQLSGAFEATVVFGAEEARLTPYTGASLTSNWVSNRDRRISDGALFGLEYILGLAYRLREAGHTRLRVEVRPGYVRTQEHTVQARLGVSYTP